MSSFATFWKNVVVCFWLLATATSGQSQLPNILLMLTDDLGYASMLLTFYLSTGNGLTCSTQHDPAYGFPLDALNPNGGTPVTRPIPRLILSTPNLVRFAKQSLRATMSYAPSSLCAPSRASIFSERQVGATSIRGNSETLEYSNGSKLAGTLRDERGYHTAYFGKWGLGKFAGGPWSYGFDIFVGQVTHRDAHVVFPEAITWFNSSKNSIPTKEAELNALLKPIVGNVKKKWSESTCPLDPNSPCTYVNDIFRDQALSFITTPRNAPFFVVWAPTYPHSGRYHLKGKMVSPVKVMTPGREGTTKHQVIRGHAAQIEMHFDVDVGKLLDALEANENLNSNTFVVVTSDNGAQNDTLNYNCELFHSAGGLRGCKRSMFDGGLRVPTLIRYPGVVPAGVISRVPHVLYDLGPTFRELAGLPAKAINGPKGEPSAALSMLTSWKSGVQEVAPKRDFLFMELCLTKNDNSCQFATIDVRGNLQAGEPVYKLIKRKPGRFLLFDLLDSPNESHQVPKSHLRKLKIAELLDATRKSRSKYTFSLGKPTPKPTKKKTVRHRKG